MLVEKNDVVQIVPSHSWGGCFIHVTEVKHWGVYGFTELPMQGVAYIQLTHDEYARIGKAVFVPVETNEG